MTSVDVVGGWRWRRNTGRIGPRPVTSLVARTLRAAAIALIVSITPGCAARRQVTVRHEQMALPWYTCLSVTQVGPGMYHPYPVAAKAGPETYAGRRIFETIVLENEYLAVHVAPEIQGAIVRAIYKPTGEDLFFYEGKAKEWLPFWESGVKASFPHREHGMGTLQPASWYIDRRPDGSVTVALWMEFSRHNDPWHGKPYGRHSTMLLSQLVTLRPGEGSFTITCRVTNPTPYRQGLQFWNDAFFPRNHTRDGVVQADAVPPAISTSELIYPAAYVSHHAGRDFRRFDQAMTAIARYDNVPHISIFSWDMAYGFAGVWYPAVAINRLRLSDPNAAPGAKIFINGEGRYRPGNLRSHTYNFVELWGGFDNIFEGVEHWIHPGQVREFTHRFALVKGIGKVDFANDDVAVNVATAGDRPLVEAVTLRPVAMLRATWNGRGIGWPVRCGPDRPARFDLPGAGPGRLKLIADGKTILDRPFPLPIPDDTSAHNRIRGFMSRRHHGTNERRNPEGYIRMAGGYPRGSTDRGRVLLRLGRLADAAACLRVATLTDGDDGEAWHLLGAVALEQGHAAIATAALDRAMSAARAYPRAAYFRAIAAIADGDRAAASRLLANLTAAQPDNWEARLLKAWVDSGIAATKRRAFRDALALEAQDPADPRAKWVLVRCAKAAGDGHKAEQMNLALQKLLQEPGARRRLVEFQAATRGRYVHPARLRLR